MPGQVVPVGGSSASPSEGKLLVVLVDSRDNSYPPLLPTPFLRHFSSRFVGIMLLRFPPPTLAAPPLGKRAR